MKRLLRIPFIAFLAILAVAPFAGGKTTFEVVDRNGSLRKLYEVTYSRNRRYYVRGRPAIHPINSGSNLIEIFDARISRDPGIADNPIWKTRIRGWSQLYVGNSGRTIISVSHADRTLPFKEEVIDSLAMRGAGVVIVSKRGRDGRKVRRSHPIEALTDQLTKISDSVFEGDISLMRDGYSTYRWYRSDNRRRDRMTLKGFGRETVFDLSSGKQIR